MVYLIGVDHQVQNNGGSMSPERRRAIGDFSAFLDSKAKELDVTMLAEEFNEDLVKSNRASNATVQKVAMHLGLKHLFCDPTRTEREELGIHDDNDRREDFWLSCIEKHLKRERILFVCGAQHLETFKSQLIKKGVHAEILPERFGIGLPPPTIDFY